MRIVVQIVLAMVFSIVCQAGEIPSPQSIFTGKVVSITDGDTIRVLIDDEQLRVRLEGIDAPEAKQAFGKRAKEHLIGLVGGKTVELHATGRDRYGRTLAKMILDGRDINHQMISDGFAWHYEYYNSEPHYAEAQQQAQRSKRGLFFDASPVPPWEFRKKK